MAIFTPWNGRDFPSTRTTIELPWTQALLPPRRRRSSNGLFPRSLQSTMVRNLPPFRPRPSEIPQDRRSGLIPLRFSSRPFGLASPVSGPRDSFSACSLVKSSRCVLPVPTSRPRSSSVVDGPYRLPRPSSCEHDHSRLPLRYLTVSSSGTLLCLSPTPRTQSINASRPRERNDHRLTP